jgi:hypothetical protein
MNLKHSETLEEAMRQLSGCTNDDCPKLFEDGDDYVVQGPIDALGTPDGETAVRVPKAILDVLKSGE